mmetsp:Transcript_14845/g.23463  ORF Transcript_14845/g.23463 Transcript_14845/m.23463 type:complete len:452 (+) Transcript_14845:40-1395(+)
MRADDEDFFSLRGFLQKAKPDWTSKTLDRVEEKLASIGVYEVTELEAAIRERGESSVNHLLLTKGEKTFNEDTIKTFKKVSRDQARLRRDAPPRSSPTSAHADSRENIPPSSANAPSGASSKVHAKVDRKRNASYAASGNSWLAPTVAHDTLSSPFANVLNRQKRATLEDEMRAELFEIGLDVPVSCTVGELKDMVALVRTGMDRASLRRVICRAFPHVSEVSSWCVEVVEPAVSPFGQAMEKEAAKAIPQTLNTKLDGTHERWPSPVQAAERKKDTASAYKMFAIAKQAKTNAESAQIDLEVSSRMRPEEFSRAGEARNLEREDQRHVGSRLDATALKAQEHEQEKNAANKDRHASGLYGFAACATHTPGVPTASLASFLHLSREEALHECRSKGIQVRESDSTSMLAYLLKMHSRKRYMEEACIMNGQKILTSTVDAAPTDEAMRGVHG